MTFTTRASAASAFKMCVALNTQAIYFTRDGRHRDSSQALRLSLEHLKPCMGLPDSQHLALSMHRKQELEALQEKTELELANQIEREQSFHHTHEMPPSLASVSIENVLPHIDPILLQHNALVFCPRMFYLSLTDANKLGLSKVFMILLYNQAVSKHVQGLLYMTNYKNHASRHHSPQELLATVYRLYQATLEISRVGFSAGDHRQLTGVLAAATNNAGHVASSLQLHQETNRHIQFLKNLMTAYTANRSVAAPGSLPLDAESIFFESLCIFMEGTFLTLAAAA